MTPFLRNYIKLAGTSEAPEFLFLWSIISGVAALLSRNVYLQFGDSRINPNLYVMIVGDPGTRKSSAIKAAKRRLKAIGYKSFCGDKVTMQKFLCDLAGVDEEGKRPEDSNSQEWKLDDVTLETLGFTNAAEWVDSYIAQDEFSDFIGINNYPFISLLGNFWDIDEPYEYRLKNSKSLDIPIPLVNVLGGTTPGQFNTIFPAAIADQGFLSRLILVSAAPTGKQISWPEANSKELLQEIDTHLLKIAKMAGEAKASKEVRGLLDKVYKKGAQVDDGRFATYATRRHTQLIKLCMIMAATKLSLTITEEDVVLANTLLTYTERHMPDALGQFGKQENSDVSTRIVDILRRAKAPMSIPEIFPKVSHDVQMSDFIKLMHNLNHANKIQIHEGKYLPIKKPIQQADDAHVDWQLLKGIAPDLIP
jgi:Protein of unknown function (DUF3987)